MKLLDEALDRMRPTLTDKIAKGDFSDSEYRYSGDTDYNYFGYEDTTADSIARLRLDWEIAEGQGWSETPSSVSNFMIDRLRDDLGDLIVNGDIDNVADALYKAMDGSKKRGKEPVNVDVFAAVMYREYIPRKKTSEYTMYLLLAVDWEK